MSDLISCENANDELHDKVAAYKLVLKEIVND